MVTAMGRPSVVRRQLGRRLRRLREKAGKTIEDVIAAHVASRTKMWRIEAGRIVVKPGDVLALGRLYGADNSTVDELLALAEATRDTGYLEDFGAVIPLNLGLYADLEASAAAITTYNSELVHGLLQTPDYARAVMHEPLRRINPPPDFDVQQRLSFRLQRQRAFFDRPSPGRLDAVLTAGAVSILVGSEAVMEAQIAHLRAISERDGVSVRILPFSDGLTASMRGPFAIFDFDDPDDPSLVHVESLIGHRYIERADHIAKARAALAEARAKAVPVKEYFDGRKWRCLDQGEGQRC